MKPLQFRPEVESDVDDVWLWYDQKTAGLGDQFADAVDEAFDVIARMGSIFPFVFDDVRAIQVSRFPFIVYYRERLKRFEVLAVMHGQRDTAAWQYRL